MKTIEMDRSIIRQYDLLPPEKLNVPITVVGAGAVGGWVVLSLAKMGFSMIEVYDPDHVEEENFNCQLYGLPHIGMPKVEALQKIVFDWTGRKIIAIPAEVPNGKLPRKEGIVISAVDSMSVRAGIWESQRLNAACIAVIDPRMGAETALLYVSNPINSLDLQSYPKTLYTDSEAVAEPCTRKATAYCALSLSGLVCAQVKSLVTGNPYSRVTQWDIPGGAMMAWKSE